MAKPEENVDQVVAEAKRLLEKVFGITVTDEKLAELRAQYLRKS
jgi:benzoyl-CoA reductase/2-hydroxyglutaryl-CoA dehydratase subunit BcrC/BadD/HgdB